MVHLFYWTEYLFTSLAQKDKQFRNKDKHFTITFCLVNINTPMIVWQWNAICESSKTLSVTFAWACRPGTTSSPEGHLSFYIKRQRSWVRGWTGRLIEGCFSNLHCRWKAFQHLYPQHMSTFLSLPSFYNIFIFIDISARRDGERRGMERLFKFLVLYRALLVRGRGRVVLWMHPGMFFYTNIFLLSFQSLSLLSGATERSKNRSK